MRVIRKGRSSSGLVLAAAAVVEVEGSAATLDRWKSRPISCLFHHHPLLLLPQQLLLLTVLLPAFEAKVSPLMASWHTTTLMLLLLLLVLLY